MRRRYAGPGRLRHQRLPEKRLHDDLQRDAAGGQQDQWMASFMPEPVQTRGDQPIQDAGQAAIMRQPRFAPPQPRADTGGGEQQGRREPPAQARLEHHARQQQGGNIPKRMPGVAVYPVPGQQPPPFPVRYRHAVEDPALGGGPEDQIRGDCSRAEQQGTPRQRQATVARAIGRCCHHDRRSGSARASPASHATQAMGRRSSMDHGPRAPLPL